MVSVLKCLVGAAATWAVLALAPLAWGQASFGQRPIYGQMPFPINPNPQIAKGEDFAASAEKAGVSYEGVIQRITNLGLRWQPESFA